MKKLLFVSALVLLVACGAGQPADTDVEVADIDELEAEGELEIPPEGSLPLSEIVASIEIAGHTQITEAEFENGVWELEFVVGDEEYELRIDPMTGEALSDEPQKPDDD